MSEQMEMQKPESRNREEVIRRTITPAGIKNSRSFREKRFLIAIKATELFIEKGYHQTSIRDICTATGMSMGNLYRYFQNKEDLLHLVFTQYHFSLKNILFDRKEFLEEDPKQTLKRFIGNFMARKGEFLDEMMMTNCESRFLSKAYLQKARLQEIEGIRKLEEILAAGARQGVFHIKDTYFAAVMMMQQLSVLATKGWMFEERYTEKDVDTLLEEFILKAISS